MALLEFYGEECPHCIRMHPLIAQLEKDLGVKVEKFETWHDDANNAKREGHDAGFCGGVPFFVNTESGEKLCGAVPYETLKRWAEGGKAA